MSINKDWTKEDNFKLFEESHDARLRSEMKTLIQDILTAALIRDCAAYKCKKPGEWVRYYFNNILPKEKAEYFRQEFNATFVDRVETEMDRIMLEESASHSFEGQIKQALERVKASR